MAGGGMSLWCIENLDDAGEGMFLVEAEDEMEALRIHAEKNRGMKVTRCEQVAWVDLALVTGERGESSYFERQRQKP
jgi:hypothetical protein